MDNPHRRHSSARTDQRTVQMVPFRSPIQISRALYHVIVMKLARVLLEAMANVRSDRTVQEIEACRNITAPEIWSKIARLKNVIFIVS